MTIFIVILFTWATGAWLAHARRLAALRYLESAERLRIRFSALRHRLVMHAGSGEMLPHEKNAFHFLYPATTFMLRHPARYPSISLAFCVFLLEPTPKAPPKLERKDLSATTLPILKEYVTACDDLVQQFAGRTVLFLAYLSGESVVDCFRNMGRRRRELNEERNRIKRWREAGAGALNTGGMASAS